jgi:hypothetical protein
MTKPVSRYVREQVAIAAAVNLLLNAGLGWLLHRHRAVVPLEGEQSATTDLMITAFLVPLLVTVIVRPLVQRDVARGKVACEPLTTPSPDVLRWLPDHLIGQGLLLGLIGLLLVGGPIVWLLRTLDVDGLSVGAFVGAKAGMAGLLALGTARWLVVRTLAASVLHRTP